MSFCPTARKEQELRLAITSLLSPLPLLHQNSNFLSNEFYYPAHTLCNSPQNTPTPRARHFFFFFFFLQLNLKGSNSFSFKLTIITVESSQTRMFTQGEGQLHARWWLYSPILDVHTPLHFGQECSSLFLPTVSFLCGFTPLCLELTTGFSQC